jgi:hypothetical protein
MFKITLNYKPGRKTTSINANGTTLIYNGVAHDFSALNNGDCVEAIAPAKGIIKKIDGVIHITLDYRFDEALAEPMQSTEINDYIVDLVSGELVSPIKLRSKANV